MFEGLASCVRDQKRYNENIKNETKINPKPNEKWIQVSWSKKVYQNETLSGTNIFRKPKKGVHDVVENAWKTLK